MLKRVPEQRGVRSLCAVLLVIGVQATFSEARAAKCDRDAFRVVLDVGHTPESPGAISARGVPEFEFNLRLGQRMEREMLARGFAKTTLLVTRGQAQPGLAARVASANRANADLFVSIHHDSVPEALLANWQFLGADGRHNDQFKGHSIFVSAEHPQYRRSLAFARSLGLALKAKGLAYTPHYTEKFMGLRRRQLVDKEAGVYRFDRLVVLTTTRMPAVLLEAGSIINRDEELAMESPERQASIAEAAADAVAEFCTPPRARSPKRAER